MHVSPWTKACNQVSHVSKPNEESGETYKTTKRPLQETSNHDCELGAFFDDISVVYFEPHQFEREMCI